MDTTDNRQEKFLAWDGSLDPETKARRYGVARLTDSELLGLILRTGTRDRTAVGVASELLAYRGRQLLNLCDLSEKELTDFAGIGKIKALQLKAIAELSLRITRTQRINKLDFSNAQSVADFYMELMRHESQEILLVALFDSKGKYMEDAIISRGTLDRTMFSPREIFSYAVRRMAGFIIMLHNHPSGDPKPSADDVEATRQIASCGKMMGIPLLDHVIIGDNVFFSFCREKLL